MVNRIEHRLTRLERANSEAISPPDFDYKAELIRRVNLVAERMEANGITPPPDEDDPAEFIKNFKEWVRSRYGN